MSKKIIVISGSPGTGKGRLARLLAQKLEFSRLDLHHHYKEISVKYNRSKQCYDVDLKKFEKLVREEKKRIERKTTESAKGKRKEENKGLIVDSHIAHLLPKKLVDLCIILTCSDLKKLKQRLKARKYSQKKVRENLDAEIFQVCLVEAKERGHKVIMFDVGKKDATTKIINAILPALN